MILLRHSDSRKGILSKIYHRMFALVDSLKPEGPTQLTLLGEEVRDKMLEYSNKRWSYLHRPTHAAAYFLDPEYAGQDSAHNPELQRGFNEVRNRMFEDRKVFACV